MINFLLLVLKVGNLKTILFIQKLSSALSELRRDVLLSCAGEQVSAITFDMSQSRERTGIFIIAGLVLHQFFPFYIWEYPAFSSLLHGD